MSGTGQTANNFKSFAIYSAIFVAFTLLSILHPADEPFGLLSLLPICFTIVTAIITKRALEPLLGGVIAGILLLDPTSVFSQLGTVSASALGNKTIVWIIL
ncbi:MAG: sodium:proton antiporter, partial [Gammaproteobacteria bacterium]